jgi:hypothetical protein
MPFDSFGVVTLTLAFIVPGFIYSSVLRWFTVPVNQDTTKENLARFTFSCWNFALWSWQIYRMFTVKWEPIDLAGWWFAIIFCSPILIGIVVGFVVNQKPYQDFIRWLPKKYIYTTSTAWDRVWSNSHQGWVGILLRDGSKIFGRWDYDSEASWDADHRDIYLSRVYEVDYQDNWKPVERSAGVLVNGDDIVLIELWDDTVSPL